MKLTITGIIFLFATQVFIVKSMEDRACMNLSVYEHSELDKTRIEVRDLLVQLERKDKKLFNGQSNVTRGYQTRMMSASDNQNELLTLKKNILRRIKTVTDEYRNNKHRKKVSVQEMLIKWIQVKKYIKSNLPKLTLNEEGSWILKMQEIEDGFKASCLNKDEVNLRLNDLRRNFMSVLAQD
jgi:hypothetical protein